MCGSGSNKTICVHSPFRPTNRPNERNHLDYYLNFMFSLLLFISTKILLITYVKCDFVCRTNSQLQVLSSFQCNVQISCTLLLRSIYEDGVCVCNVHAIKCLEPHVIYHEDDTCVQTKLKSSTQLLCTKQRSFRSGIPRTRSHYQCVYFHLHLSFFLV